MWVIRAILIVAVIFILLYFAIYNAAELAAVKILGTRYINVPVIVIAFWSCMFGLLISMLLFISVYFKQAGEIRRLKRITDSLNAEISALRNRPIEEADDKFLLSDKEDNK